jgi:peroxiredoxin
MSDAPENRRRLFLFGARALLVALTAYVVWVMIGLEIVSWGIDSKGVEGHPVAKAIFPWMNGLFRLSRAVLVTALLYATYAVFRKSGRECRRALLTAFIGVLFSVAGYGGYLALAYRAMADFVPPRPDFANRPGSLTSVDEQAPDITITTLDGTSIQLSDLRGRVVLVNFFATWCGPCKWELPDLQAIWNEVHADDEFRMFIIGREESAEIVRAFRDEHHFTFPMAADPDRSAFDRFATESVPRTYLIDRDGNIAYQCTGYDFEKLELAKLKALLKKELGKEK